MKNNDNRCFIISFNSFFIIDYIFFTNISILTVWLPLWSKRGSVELWYGLHIGVGWFLFPIPHCIKKVQLKYRPGHRPLESDIESACTYSEPDVLKHSLFLQVWKIWSYALLVWISFWVSRFTVKAVRSEKVKLTALLFWISSFGTLLLAWNYKVNCL